MISHEHEPPVPERLIKPDGNVSLQSQIDEAIAQGCRRVVLEGIFTSSSEKPFSLLTLSQDLEIVGKGETVFDGQGKITHLLFIGDGVKAKIAGVKFMNGNTGCVQSRFSLDGHPMSKLNIFRYLDGGAITTGIGSELTLEDCGFTSNHSSLCAGAISNCGGLLRLNNCEFSGNTAGDVGSAVDNFARGSITIVDNCRFENNPANLLGKGTHGAITAFPDTFLIVRGSHFSEPTAAIDYRPNQLGEVFVLIDDTSTFSHPNAIVQPRLNYVTRRAIIPWSLKVMARYPHLVALERIPKADQKTVEKHRALFNELTDGQQSISF